MGYITPCLLEAGRNQSGLRNPCLLGSPMQEKSGFFGMRDASSGPQRGEKPRWLHKALLSLGSLNGIKVALPSQVPRIE